MCLEGWRAEARAYAEEYLRDLDGDEPDPNELEGLADLIERVMGKLHDRGYGAGVYDGKRMTPPPAQEYKTEAKQYPSFAGVDRSKGYEFQPSAIITPNNAGKSLIEIWRTETNKANDELWRLINEAYDTK